MEEQACKTNPLFLYTKSLPQRVRGFICIKTQYGELLINNTKNVLSRGPKGCGLAKEEKINFFLGDAEGLRQGEGIWILKGWVIFDMHSEKWAWGWGEEELLGGADYATNQNKESEHVGHKGHIVGHGLRVVLGSCHCGWVPKIIQ